MNVRLLVATAAAMGVACCGGTVLTTGATAAPPPSCTVTVSGVSPVIAHHGDQVTLTGSGFTCGGAAGGAPAVTVGGRAVSLVGPASDSSLVVEAPETGGAVQVNAHDAGCHGCPEPAPSNDDRLLLAAPAATAATLTAPEGGRLSVSGSGLGLAGHLAGVDATACGQRLTAGSHDDTGVSLAAPAQFCQGSLTLRLSAYTDTEHDATTTMALAAGRVDTAMVAGALSTAHAAPGERVSVVGSGFGQSGTALLGGRPLPSTWFDRAVEITPEPGSASGELELVRFDGRRVDAGRLVVDPPAHSAAPRPAAGTAHIPPTPTPSAAPARPPSPHPRLALRPARDSGEPGHDVPFTVTLTAGGAPLPGAAVDLGFLRAPGGDATVTPALGVTDSAGRVSGLLHLSRLPGEHVILARAGQSSDQVTVAACCRAATPPAAGRVEPDGTDSTGAPRGLIVGALCACLALFLSGFVLNIATGPRRRARISLE